MESQHFSTAAQAVARPSKTVYAYFSGGRITCADMMPPIAADSPEALSQA